MGNLKPFGRIILIVMVVLLLAFISGCVGPIWSSVLIQDADSNFRAAKVIGAEKYAPYEFYKAEEFLHKARQKQAYGQFERAVDYAKIAKEMAIAAQAKSHDAKASESGPSTIPQDLQNPPPVPSQGENIKQINTP